MRSYTVGSLGNVRLRVHLSLIALPVVVIFLANPVRLSSYVTVVDQVVPGSLATGLVPQNAVVAGLLTTAILFASVTLHELGHAAVATREGIGVDSVTLWILGGFVTVPATTTRWDSEARIAAAGPAVNAVLATLAATALLLDIVPPTVAFLLVWTVTVNVPLAIFNLLPVVPLDGGRILRATLARNRPYAVADRLATRIGWAVLIMSVLVLAAPLFVLI